VLDVTGRPVVAIDVSQHAVSEREAWLAALLDSLDGAIAASRSGELTVLFDLRGYRCAAGKAAQPLARCRWLVVSAGALRVGCARQPGQLLRTLLRTAAARDAPEHVA
jgi:hypothetical protein